MIYLCVLCVLCVKSLLLAVWRFISNAFCNGERARLFV